MIAMQRELLPREITGILQGCCESATSTPFDQLEAGIVEQLGRPLDQIFRTIDKEPMASAYSAFAAAVAAARAAAFALPRKQTNGRKQRAATVQIRKRI